MRPNNSVFEIVVESRHVFDALVGQSLKVTSGINGGTSFTIAAVNNARTGYIIGATFGGTFPQAISYEIPVVADITSPLTREEKQLFWKLSKKAGGFFWVNMAACGDDQIVIIDRFLGFTQLDAIFIWFD